MTAVNLATADLFHAEITRLQAENERLLSQPCPHVTGNVTQHCTLTDAEREAVQYAAASIRDQGLHRMSAGMVAYAATLRGLLERTAD